MQQFRRSRKAKSSCFQVILLSFTYQFHYFNSLNSQSLRLALQSCCTTNHRQYIQACTTFPLFCFSSLSASLRWCLLTDIDVLVAYVEELDFIRNFQYFVSNYIKQMCFLCCVSTFFILLSSLPYRKSLL